nr:transmembrane protein 8B isoform X5 [Pongo pygmaeus]
MAQPLSRPLVLSQSPPWPPAPPSPRFPNRPQPLPGSPSRTPFQSLPLAWPPSRPRPSFHSLSQIPAQALSQPHSQCLLKALAQPRPLLQSPSQPLLPSHSLPLFKPQCPAQPNSLSQPLPSSLCLPKSLPLVPPISHTLPLSQPILKSGFQLPPALLLLLLFSVLGPGAELRAPGKRDGVWMLDSRSALEPGRCSSDLFQRVPGRLPPLCQCHHQGCQAANPISADGDLVPGPPLPVWGGASIRAVPQRDGRGADAHLPVPMRGRLRALRPMQAAAHTQLSVRSLRVQGRVERLGLHRQCRCAHLWIPTAVHTLALPEQPHVSATCGPGHSESICAGSCSLHLHHVLLHGMRWRLHLITGCLCMVVGHSPYFHHILRGFGNVCAFTVCFTDRDSSASQPIMHRKWSFL